MENCGNSAFDRKILKKSGSKLEFLKKLRKKSQKSCQIEAIFKSYLFTKNSRQIELELNLIEKRTNLKNPEFECQT